MDGALSWDKRSLPSAQYGAGGSGFQNVSIKAGIALNFGGCNSYATAKVAGVALVYKGNDFALTDLPKL